MLPYKKNLKEISRNLRLNLTEPEKCLWTRLKLKHLGYTFYRQKPIGDYIVDFYCPKARLVVEVDGGHHFTSETAANDRVRDEYFHSLGLTTLRFSNSEVLERTDKVAESIYKRLVESSFNPPFAKGKKEIDKDDNIKESVIVSLCKGR